jgi:hypothetical protein
MTLLLPNVRIATARAAQNAQGGTTPNAPYLTDQFAHGEPVAAITDYRSLPAGALETDFVFRVDVGTDIVAEDLIISCTLLDGVTPWALTNPNGNETLRVELADDGPPNLLPYRDVYVKRYTGGGQVF